MPDGNNCTDRGKAVPVPQQGPPYAFGQNAPRRFGSSYKAEDQHDAITVLRVLCRC